MFTNGIENHCWEYLAEGNSSIVFSCCEIRWVLRLNKFSSDEGSHMNRSPQFSPSQGKVYTEKILKPLFGDNRYFIDTQVIELSDDFKERLIKIAVSCPTRPQERKCNNLTAGNLAVLMPHLGFYENDTDLCKEGGTIDGSSYCLEIKPKWGFIPKLSPQHQSDCAASSLACRFCMHQELKLVEGKIKSCSVYCPLDLFSHCTCRLKRALHYLFQEPQNNLRVFHNGELIYSGLFVKGGKSSLSTLCHDLNNILVPGKEKILDASSLVNILSSILVADSWQESLFPVQETKRCKAKTSPSCRLSESEVIDDSKCTPLALNGVLQKLLKVQQISESTMDEINSIYQEVIKTTNQKEILNNLDDFSSPSWETFTTKMKLDEQILKKDLAEGTTEELVFELQKFLVSATFRDCSIMITFKEALTREEKPQRMVKDLSTGCNYAYKIKLIDLDPKSSSKIEYYKELNDKILGNFIQKQTKA